MTESKGFAFLNARGMFVSIAEIAGYTGLKVFVAEVASVNQATVLTSKDLSKHFVNLTPRITSEFNGLTPVPVTISRVVTVGQHDDTELSA